MVEVETGISLRRDIVEMRGLWSADYGMRMSTPAPHPRPAVTFF